MTKAIRAGEYFSSVEQIVSGLRELLQSSPYSPELKSTVKKLRSQLKRYFALKHDGTYLAEVLDLFPNWHRKVQYLEDHCRELVVDIHLIHNMLTNAEKEAHNHLSVWLVRFDKYRVKEGSLIQDAYLTDLGVDH